MAEQPKTEAEGATPATHQEEQEAERYPGHEDPDALRERAGLGGHEGREAELTPEVDADAGGRGS